MNRRHFLRAGLTSGIILGSASYASAQRLSRPASRRPGTAKNIIFLVSDGMSSGTLAIADHFVRWRDGRPSNWVRLYEEGRGHRGLMDTASLDSLVTDSAAAAAAWGCGFRVNNNVVNMSPTGEKHPPILALAKAAGKSTGLVTTATVTHATPAGFGANVPHRSMEQEIAVQYLDNEYDVLLGGGRRVFTREHREDRRDLAGEFGQKGFRLMRTRADLEAARGGGERWLGLFGDSHLPYELDRKNSADLTRDVPTLAEMTEAALERLSQNASGFLVQIEGARVDMAAHATDIGGLVFDQIAFDEAVQVAVDFSERNPDTLVIVTTDHANANPGLTSGAGGAEGGAQTFSRIANFRGTHGPILDRINAASGVSEIQQAIAEVTQLPITRADAELLHGRFQETYRAPFRRLNGVSAILGQILSNYTEIGWMSNTHTSDFVELLAWGPGSEKVKPFNLNTDLFRVMTEAAGIPTSAPV